MACNAPECNSSNVHHLRKCHGTCGRSFHAACIGVKRDWEDDLRNFVLPLCEQCEPDYTEKISIRKILIKQFEQQNKILNQLQNVIHMQDAVECIEKRMSALESHCQAGNRQKASTLAILQKLTASINNSDLLLDVARNANTEFFRPLNARMAESFGRIEEKINASQLAILAFKTTATKCPSDTNS